MALPTLNKTWIVSPNNISAGSAVVLTANQNLMYLIKNLFKSPGTWTVWGSNDGGGAGHFGNGDAIDRWDATTKLIWAAAGSNHSWIVLSQSGLGGNASVCIDCSNVNSYSYYINMWCSPNAGFGVANGGTDGTATAAPTASDQFLVLNAGSILPWGGTAATTNTRNLVSFMQSTDGQCTRLAIFRKGGVAGLWILDKAKNPISQWTYPIFGFIKGDSNDATTDPDAAGYAALYAANIRAYLSTACSGLFTGETGSAAGGAGSMIGEIMTFADEDTLEWPMAGIAIYFSTVGHRGHKGAVFDMWFGSTARITGDGYPASGTTLQFIQIGDLIMPWDQTTALITT